MIRTLAVKVIEGLHSQSWEVIGRGGTWAGAMRPLEIYIRSKVKRAVKAERQACAEMQRRAAAYDGLVAQRDALLEALCELLADAEFLGWDTAKARAAIKTVEDGK